MTTNNQSTSYIANIIKTCDKYKIEWNKLEHQHLTNSLRLFFNEPSKEEEKIYNLKEFNLGIRAFLSIDEKICILEIPKDLLICQLNETNDVHSDSIPLFLESYYDPVVDALLIRLISSLDSSKVLYKHTLLASDDYYGSDILFHMDKTDKIYSIEVLFASEFINLNFK